jgi:hypothetical protein
MKKNSLSVCVRVKKTSDFKIHFLKPESEPIREVFFHKMMVSSWWVLNRIDYFGGISIDQ